VENLSRLKHYPSSLFLSPKVNDFSKKPGDILSDKNRKIIVLTKFRLDKRSNFEQNHCS
jgi:hypothetical protein